MQRRTAANTTCFISSDAQVQATTGIFCTRCIVHKRQPLNILWYEHVLDHGAGAQLSPAMPRKSLGDGSDVPEVLKSSLRRAGLRPSSMTFATCVDTGCEDRMGSCDHHVCG